MVASFSASNQVGEMMKNKNKKRKPKADEELHSSHQAPPAPEEPEIEI